MDLQHLRNLKRSGQLHDAAISPYPDGQGWLLAFHDNKGDTIPLTTAAGTHWCFHNLDRASQAAREIGFEELHIVE